MRKTISSLAMIFIFAGTSCGPKVSGSALESGTDRSEPGVARIAAGPLVKKVPVPPEKYEGPPHRFEPSSHPPRHRYSQTKVPDVRTLPKFKFRMNRCFEDPSRDRRKSRMSSGSSLATGGSVPSLRARKSKPSRSTKKSPAASKGGGAGSLSGDAYSVGASAGAESLSPPAPAEPKAQPQRGMEKERAAEGGMARPAAEPQNMPTTQDDDLIALEESEQTPEDREMQYDDWGAAIYLSNDDTMSLSSAQRVIFAIDNFLPLQRSHIRPHELLNYFSFDTTAVQPGNDFSVYAEVAPDPKDPGIYSLGLSVDGRPVGKANRRNAVLTLVIDRSGSMREEGRMDYLKRGLERMLGELKTGDMVHMVLFDHEVCVPAENFVVGRDNPARLQKIIRKLKPRGSTDLHRGLSRGYDIADRSHQRSYTNRVVMVTDALTNTGVTDQEMISMISKYYDSRRIRLSGIGVGRHFNDALLDRLTERGKGAYVFLGSEAEVDAVFGPRFVSLIETTALDVHFRLHLPPSLRMNVFYGEESSVVKEDVKEIHYFAGTSQLFLADLMARGGELRPQDGVMLSIEYADPETGEALVEEYAFGLGEIMARKVNVQKGRLIMAWIDMLSQMATAAVPTHHYPRAASWRDPKGWERCEDGKAELGRLAAGLENDPEVKRVNRLFEKYCARYERPRNPIKRLNSPQRDTWPGAN